MNIYIAGHNGMVGSALKRLLSNESSHNLITASKAELDLTNQIAVMKFFGENSIDHVYLAAAKVGGIYANNEFPADFIYQNLMIEANIIHAAHTFGVQQLLFLGSSCIYPKLSNQPITESELLTGSLEPTNEPYALAKIAGIKLCESYRRQYGCDFRSLMPTNLYGQNDNFHPLNSHVIPAMMLRFHEAKLKGSESVAVWGSGNPRREFLHVDDLASACIHVMNLDRNVYESNTDALLTHVNVGTGVDHSIRELAGLISSVVGYQGEVVFDTSKPDGAPRKLLDVSRLQALGWQAQIGLEQGLSRTYEWFLKNPSHVRF